jgi:DNA-binding response OmpR family regulator
MLRYRQLKIGLIIMIKKNQKEWTVCIIDDDENIREIYGMKFKSEGFVFIEAADGDAGLTLVREKKPDIILLDMLMPGKDGCAVLEEIQKDEKISGIPIVVLSNLDDEKAFNRVGKFDTHFYLVKSLTTPQKAVDIVCEVLKIPRVAVPI